jgi:hypothetical protein
MFYLLQRGPSSELCNRSITLFANGTVIANVQLDTIAPGLQNIINDISTHIMFKHVISHFVCLMRGDRQFCSNSAECYQWPRFLSHHISYIALVSPTKMFLKHVTAVVGEALLYTFTLKIKTCFAQQSEINTWNNIHIC